MHTRECGTSNITDQCDDLDVILNYAHWNLLVQDVDDSLVPLAERRGLGLINASPLHLGVLTTGTVPDWHPAAAEVKNAGRQVVELLEGQGIEAPVFALRYAMDHTAFATTLVGIRNPRELEQNLKAIDYRIDPEVLEQLQPVIDPVRNRTWPVGRPENQA